MIFRLKNWLKNQFFKPDSSYVRILTSWLASSPENLPSTKESRSICLAIENQIIGKISNKDLAEMLYGLIQYRRSGLTPSHSHYAFIRAYEQTNGLAQEIFHQALFRSSVDLSPALDSSLFFKNVSSDDLSQWVGELQNNGYCLLGQAVSSAHVDELVKRISGMRFAPRGSTQWDFLDPLNPPNCNVADVFEYDLKSDELIAQLVSDPVLLNIASTYLGAIAKPLNYCLWYTFPSTQASSEAAQLYHYDLDTLRWLKIFIFLSDVGPENGPHEYVEGSHKVGLKPVELLRRDYVRLSDEDIDQYYKGKRKQILAPKGTVVLADTRCFHKGVNPVSGYRLLLQPIYAPSELCYRQY